jgi:hypothetical protein
MNQNLDKIFSEIKLNTMPFWALAPFRDQDAWRSKVEDEDIMRSRFAVDRLESFIVVPIGAIMEKLRCFPYKPH